VEKEGYMSLTVNHSNEFRNKDNGACLILIAPFKNPSLELEHKKHLYDSY
jgi:hypothetical protein